MRCTKCGFISFDHYTACKRCKADLAEPHRTLQGTSIKVEVPLFLAPALQEALHEGYGAAAAEEEFLAEAPASEPVGLDAVAAELESQTMLDGILTSAATQAALEEEVPSIDLGQFETESSREEPEAELPTLDLGLAMDTEEEASGEPPGAGVGEERAEEVALELPELVAEAPGGEEAPELEAQMGAGLSDVNLPSDQDLDLSARGHEDEREATGQFTEYGEEPRDAAESFQSTPDGDKDIGLKAAWNELEFALPVEQAEAGESMPREVEAAEATAAEGDIDDLSLGLEEINLADLVPGAASSGEPAVEEGGGIDFDLGLLDLQGGASSPTARTEGEGDIFDLASIMEEPSAKPARETASEIVDLDDLYGAPDTPAAEPAPETEAQPDAKAEGIPFALKLEMEGESEEASSGSEEKPQGPTLDDQEFLPDLDLKLEEDK